MLLLLVLLVMLDDREGLLSLSLSPADSKPGGFLALDIYLSGASPHRRI